MTSYQNLMMEAAIALMFPRIYSGTFDRDNVFVMARSLLRLEEEPEELGEGRHPCGDLDRK